MNSLDLRDYALSHTLLGGQSFCWDRDPDGYFYGFTQKCAVKLKLENDKLFWQTFPERDNLEFIRNYLRMDVPYKKILSKIQKDSYVSLAVEKYPGLRVLGQDFEQALLSFLISSNNNIQSIRFRIRNLARRFGEKIEVDSRSVFLFPRTEILAAASLNELLECKLGFRAKFVKAASARLMQENISVRIKSLNERDARELLVSFAGIGDKIADCILVYSLSFDNVFPLDVWGKRVVSEYYKLDPKMKYEEMRVWLGKYFEGYAGWAGQFLYEYIRGFELEDGEGQSISPLNS